MSLNMISTVIVMLFLCSLNLPKLADCPNFLYNVIKADIEAGPLSRVTSLERSPCLNTVPIQNFGRLNDWPTGLICLSSKEIRCQSV